MGLSYAVGHGDGEWTDVAVWAPLDGDGEWTDVAVWAPLARALLATQMIGVVVTALGPWLRK